MERTVQHTVHVPLGFDETCDRIERYGPELLDRATALAARAVTRRGAELHATTTTSPIWIDHRPLVRDADHQATVTLDWQSSAPSGRVLPHLDARLVINGVILRGPHASTAVSLLGSFDPSAGLLRRIDDRLRRRRLVDDVTGAFLDAFVVGLLDLPIDLTAENVTTVR